MSNELSRREMSREEHHRLHELLLELCTSLATDFEPYGRRSRETDWGPDCSCGCLHFRELEGPLGADWGVCSNSKSPRAQGCSPSSTKAAASSSTMRGSRRRTSSGGRESTQTWVLNSHPVTPSILWSPITLRYSRWKSLSDGVRCCAPGSPPSTRCLTGNWPRRSGL